MATSCLELTWDHYVPKPRDCSFSSCYRSSKYHHLKDTGFRVSSPGFSSCPLYQQLCDWGKWLCLSGCPSLHLYKDVSAVVTSDVSLESVGGFLPPLGIPSGFEGRSLLHRTRIKDCYAVGGANHRDVEWIWNVESHISKTRRTLFTKMFSSSLRDAGLWIPLLALRMSVSFFSVYWLSIAV